MKSSFVTKIINSQLCNTVAGIVHHRSPYYCSISRRFLLTTSAGKPEFTIVEVREKLKKIVGSAELYGKKNENSSARPELPCSQDELPPKCMMDSYREASIPLRTRDKEFRLHYVNFRETVRIGKLLEALDTMAVWIGYTHNNPDPCQTEYKSPLSVVTAFVDNIVLQKINIPCDKDIVVRGHVTWAGQTSMEISMNVEQESTSGWDKVLEAQFLMVARDPVKKQKAFCCPLKVETPEEQDVFNCGEAHKHCRQRESQQSLMKSAPTVDEQVFIQDFFRSTIDPKSGTFRQIKKPVGAQWMEDTKLKNIIICFPEQRNLYEKIFGGFLMRAAFELGWANATMHCKSEANVIAMDDIMFTKPVEIGSLLYLSSLVVYTCGKDLQVRVHAEVVDPKSGEHQTTNVFHFTFRSSGEIPTVIPKSYAEYMMYLDGKRHFEANHEKTTACQ